MAFLAPSWVAGNPIERVPTLVRLEPERLQRVRDDVARYAQERAGVSLKAGYRDFRCVLHAHSYLSHDSRGSIAEIAAAAKQAGVAAVFLTNHPRKDLDVVAAGQRGVVDGVLFVAGAEANGFLLFPGDGKLPPLDTSDQALVDAVQKTGGMVFVAHPEEHTDWTLSRLTGMEIYNTHADFLDEAGLIASLNPADAAAMMRLFLLLDAFYRYPQEAFGAIFDPPSENLARYDAMVSKGPFAAIAANDAHQNVGFILKGADDGGIEVRNPLGELLGRLSAEQAAKLAPVIGEPEPGKILLERILDPYEVSFHYVSTHVLAQECTQASLQEALRHGRTYVAFDWIADPSGSAFLLRSGGRTGTVGDTVSAKERPLLEVEVPVSCTLRLIRNGQVVTEQKGRHLSVPLREAGLYRVEAWLSVGGEDRAWIYTGGMRVTP
ncbi:MAG: hypothetical protein ACP5VE_07695 [Chthonomonadales bacterium]